MLIMKKYFLLFPETFFAILAGYWIYENYSASGTLNYIAIGVAILMVFQLLFRKRIIGIVSGGVQTLFSAFMMLAVISEFRDFPIGDADGIKFLLPALGLFAFSTLTGLLMVLKYALQKTTVFLPVERIVA